MTIEKGLPVFIDTNILIWAVRREATAGQEDMIAKAANLVEHLAKVEARIQTSAVCLGEFLTGLPTDRHADVTAAIQRQFRMYPYDDACAVKAAWLYRHRRTELTELAATNPAAGRKIKLKNDVMIVATALVHGSKVIYTNDDDLKKIAGNLIEVKMLSDYTMQFTHQEEMFETTTGRAAVH